MAWHSTRTAPNWHSGSVDKTIRIWNVSDGKELHKLDGHPDDVYSVVFSPDGKKLASVGYGGNLFVWDVGTAKALFHQRVAPNTMTYSLAWSPDGSQLAVAGSDNKIRTCSNCRKSPCRGSGIFAVVGKDRDRRSLAIL